MSILHADHAKNILSDRSQAEEAAADLPALIAMAEKAVASVLHGDHAQRKSGSGERFWQFREYVPGDRPQDIDWRQSAKGDRIYIRQKEWQTTQTALFWCNRSIGMNFTSHKNYPAKAEAARVLTLAMAILMTRAGEQVGLLGAQRTGRSEAALQRVANGLLSAEDAVKDLPDPHMVKLPQNSAFIQVGDFLSPYEQIESGFKKFSAQSESGFVVQVLDPAEINLPYTGRVVFEDPSGQNRELVNHVTSIRAAYQQRIEDHIQSVQTLCKQYHWGYALHRTDKKIKDTLARIWSEMGHDTADTAEVRL